MHTFTILICSFFMLISQHLRAHTFTGNVHLLSLSQKFSTFSSNGPPRGSLHTFASGHKSLSTLLPDGIRFLHDVLPAALWLTLRLPTPIGGVYGLTTFRVDNLSDDLGSVSPPAAFVSVCSEGKAEQPAAYHFGSSVSASFACSSSRRLSTVQLV